MPRSVPTGSRIRDRRLALGRRQAALAVEAGISPSYLNLIEHNRRAIGGALLTRLAGLLDIDRTALSEEGDAELVASIVQVGAAQEMAPAALAQAGDLARRYPDWARTIAAQAGALERGARRLDALSDRLRHDPALAEAMHEVLSTVATVRATASILRQTPEIDRNWLGRFHANLDEDSRRLAEGAEVVMALVSGKVVRDGERLLPQEAVERFLDAHGHRFADLEARAERGGAAAIYRAELRRWTESEILGGGAGYPVDAASAIAGGRGDASVSASGSAERPVVGEGLSAPADPAAATDGAVTGKEAIWEGPEAGGTAGDAFDGALNGAPGDASDRALDGPPVDTVIATLVAQIADPVARRCAGDILRADASDAVRLPLAIVRAAKGPDDLVAAAGGDLALVLRRLGTVDPARGLAVCDVAGGMVRRVPVAGFPWPQAGAGCALWPLYQSLTQPGRAVTQMLEMPDGALWRAHAVTAPIHAGGFEAVPVLRATMLVTRADGARGGGERIVPVGPTCRSCPRDGCAARREPSMLAGGT